MTPSAHLIERAAKASVAVASYLPFSEWGGVIGDPRLVAAIVDHLTFNVRIIESGTRPYRLRTYEGPGSPSDVIGSSIQLKAASPSTSQSRN